MMQQRMLAVGRGVAMAVVFAAAAMNASAQGVIPQSTEVAVRLIDEVNSDSAGLDREYRGTVDDAVIVGGTTVLPAGTPAYLQVIRAAEAGRVQGSTLLALRIVGFEVAGRRIPVESGDATVSSTGQGKKVAKSAAVAGAAGAVLGALLGGKRGAAQGMAAGAALGAAHAVVTGQSVKVPPETRMTFVLSRDVNIE